LLEQRDDTPKSRREAQPPNDGRHRPKAATEGKPSKLRRVGRDSVSANVWHFGEKRLQRSKLLFLKQWEKPDTDAVLAIQMPMLYVPRKSALARDT
jgi:hypothetical protein